MSLSRWKLMAGVLGVSLGGLAAASQCSKPDGKKDASRQAAPPASLESPPVLPLLPPSGGSARAPAVPPLPDAFPTLPPPASTGPMVLPPVKLPETPTAPTVPTGSPAIPPILPASSSEKASPAPALPELPRPTDNPKATPPAPPAPPTPAPVVEQPATGTVPTPGTTIPPAAEPLGKPMAAPPAPPAFPDLPPMKAAPEPSMPTLPPGFGTAPPAPPVADPLVFTKPETKPDVRADVRPAAAVAVANKFRILLRVGEGEPMFEVKCGDDLVLKVVCEKVDITSPPKGNGPSEVKAVGKVRFAGFGAEGTCNELSFLAGTGEVKLSGKVTMAVKDKLGRVESELSTESMTYKLDPAVVVAGAVARP